MGLGLIIKLHVPTTPIPIPESCQTRWTTKFPFPPSSYLQLNMLWLQSSRTGPECSSLGSWLLWRPAPRRATGACLLASSTSKPSSLDDHDRFCELAASLPPPRRTSSSSIVCQEIDYQVRNLATGTTRLGTIRRRSRTSIADYSYSGIMFAD
jgi:hypothetical protein